ncbi:MAG: DUF4011 domain-containing protein [Bacteroidales bacterium]|nr:DUF4011 domain-containing protein [Bacteroidales bacterium]
MPVCQTLAIRNSGTADLQNVVVECSGEYFRDFRSPVIDVLKAKKKLRLQDVSIVPDASRIASLTEKIATSFRITVIADAFSSEKRVVHEQDYDIEIMAYDQWLGTSIQPQCLASFVTPNHPAVGNVVLKAAAVLKEITGSSSFTEYQSGSTLEVRKQVAAVYGALHGENLVYRAVPASYEEVGQRVTLPHQVLATKLGNCIEFTLLFASVLESVGINSCIVLQKGHAYLAVWLVDDSCPYSVCDDYSYLEKKCADGIDEMLVLECTQVAQESTSFEKAQVIATKNLADTDAFEMFIDVRRCRLERILPLPLTTQNTGAVEILADGVAHDECMLNVREHSRYDLSKIADSKREVTKLDIWERKLLDFSLRNSMLNLYLRQKAIQFISFNVDLVEDYLQDGQEYVIMPKPAVEMNFLGEERLMRSKMHPELQTLVTDDIKHRTLHTYTTEGDTRATLKNIYRASRNAIEETGANALFLAIGTLRWFETDVSETPRYAPILMLPVEMVYKKGDYYIRSRDEDIVLNITLIEFLRQNFDITIPGLDPLPADEHGVDVVKIFAIIRDVLKHKKRWDVEEECILGVFSFSKFLMWNDIHNHRDELLESDVVRSLVEQKLVFAPEPVAGDLKLADKQVMPNALSLPVPVDSSQMAAVMKAGQGHSFILYGPPGTGKSQTITNLIANALFQGKRVLFVAEKMAALSVVQKRLEKINLAPFCLEMHSNKITKRHVLEQLKLALGVTHIVKPEEYAAMADDLFQQRSKLIAYMEALHDVKGREGMSLYDCIVRYESIAAPALDIDTADEELQQHFSIDQLDAYDHLLARKYGAIVALVGHPSQHPLLGLHIQETDLADVAAMRASLKAAATVVQSGIGRLPQLEQAQGLRAEIMRDCSEEAFAHDATALYDEWRAVKAKWFIPRFFAKRAYLKKLRQFNQHLLEQDVDAMLGKLMDYDALHREIAGLQEVVNRYFALSLDADNLPSAEKLRHCADALNAWQAHLDKARDWYQWCAFKHELAEAGLAVVARKIEEVPIAVDALRDGFFKALFKHIATEKIAQSAVLRTFEGSIFDETVARYQQLTDEFQLLSQKELYARLAANIPHVTDNIDSSSEIGLLNRNISNGGRGTSLRDLFDKIPTLLPRLCPCMLMSPMSVAQFLDLSQDKFDLVIFDEASQMPTSEAVGAIARGKAVVVVGDPKQMPPTSFFSSTNVSDDEADIDDMESILEDCRTLEIPSLQLNWHYRSKHESLIAFSNNEYYDGELITFPSVDDQTTMVKYRFVEGTYDKGGRRSNRKEAEAIVAEIARRLAEPDSASRSIGVIAFSVVQQNLIEDLLMDLLDGNKQLREAADAMYEPIFVKNLENVQGDERDVVLFSIGYGPDKDGKVSMNFGPLNNAGGERRLNVAVSRARREMMVFSSLKASQVDLRRSKARGVAGLKHFLEYAEQQVLTQSALCVKESADTVIAQQIAQALSERGFNASTSIGRSKFKVDVAVADGADYSFGILLDGVGYRDTLTTRDREIVQPTVLKMLGWRVMRVWSVDWLNNPERVIQRIVAAIQQQPKEEAKPEVKPVFDIAAEEVEQVATDELPYKEYTPKKKSATLDDEVLAKEILEVEQPMTLPYLCRRMCACRGLARVSPSMLTIVADVANRHLHVQLVGSSAAVWTSKEQAEAYTGYRKHNGRDITEIPIVEVMNAIVAAVKEQLSIREEALTLIVAKQLGFSRRGAKVDLALNEALQILIAQGKVENAEGMLRLKA